MKWTATGCGSYRKVRPGVYEVTWRPSGHKGPKCRRRVNWMPTAIRAFLLRQAVRKQTLAVGEIPDREWAEAIDAYEKHLVATDTGEAYRTTMRRILEDLEDAGTPLSKFTPDLASSAFQTRATELRKNGYEGWGRTTNKELAMASGFFRFCVRILRCLPGNPIEAVPQFPERKLTKRNLTPSEYAAVWRTSESSVQDFMNFQLLTGCRISELVKMRWRDVDTKAGIWTMKDRKGGDDLRMPLDAMLLEILIRQPRLKDGFCWHRWVPPSFTPATVPGHGFVEGKRIAKEWWNNVLSARCEAVDVPAFTSHDLRRAAACWARDLKGVATSEIQSLLGHSTVQTTEIYAKGGDSGAKRVQSALVEVLQKALQVKQA